MELVRFCRRTLPCYLPPMALESELLTHLSISVTDLLHFWQQGPTALRANGRSLPQLPAEAHIWIVPDDISLAASARHGATDALNLDTRSGRHALSPKVFWEIVEHLQDRRLHVLLPVESADAAPIGNNKSRRIVRLSDHFTPNDSTAATYYPVMTANHEQGRLHSVKKALECTTNTGFYLDGVACRDYELGSVPLEQLASKPVFASAKPTLGQLLQLMAQDLDYLQLDVPSELAIERRMIIMKIIPADAEVARHFGLKPFDDARTTVRPTRNEAETLAEAAATEIDPTTPFRTLDICDSETLRNNHENATCLNAILRHIGYGGSSRQVVQKDYSFAALNHMATCNEPNVIQILEWHNWTLLGVLFKVAATVKRKTTPHVYHQYLVWLGLMNHL